MIFKVEIYIDRIYEYDGARELIFWTILKTCWNGKYCAKINQNYTFYLLDFTVSHFHHFNNLSISKADENIPTVQRKQ